MKTLIGYRVIKLWFLQLPAILFLLLETYKHISKFYISQSNWAFEKKNSHLFLSRHGISKFPIYYAFKWNESLLPILRRHFPVENR